MCKEFPMRYFHRRRSMLLYGLLVILGYVTLSRREGPVTYVSTPFVGSAGSPFIVPPSKHSRGDVSWLLSPEDFFHRLETDVVQTRCRKMVWFGGKSCDRKTDGEKLVCFDPDVELLPKDCVIYSFGVGGDTTFDRAASRFGCQVYMMDPTPPPNQPDLISDNPKFLPIGLANASLIIHLKDVWRGNDTDTTTRKPLTFSSYEDVHTFTHHSGPVHYLKMDIEGHEWSALEHIMKNNNLKGTLQIMVELHDFQLPRLSFDEAVVHLRKRWLFIEELEDHGFLRVAYLPTRSGYTAYKIPENNITVETCGELFLIRRKMLMD